MRVDVETMEAIEFLDRTTFPEVRQPTGVSVDVDGLVWMVDQMARATGGAFVFDPEDRSVDFVGGLVNPYTYSDMTGAASRNVQPDSPK